MYSTTHRPTMDLRIINSSSGAQIYNLQCLIMTLVKAFGPQKGTLVNRRTYPLLDLKPL